MICENISNNTFRQKENACKMKKAKRELFVTNLQISKNLHGWNQLFCFSISSSQIPWLFLLLFPQKILCERNSTEWNQWSLLHLQPVFPLFLSKHSRSRLLYSYIYPNALNMSKQSKNYWMNLLNGWNSFIWNCRKNKNFFRNELTEKENASMLFFKIIWLNTEQPNDRQYR